MLCAFHTSETGNFYNNYVRHTFRSLFQKFLERRIGLVKVYNFGGGHSSPFNCEWWSYWSRRWNCRGWTPGSWTPNSCLRSFLSENRFDPAVF